MYTDIIERKDDSMTKEINLDKIKDMAITFLYFDLEESELGKLFLIHPVFDTCMQPYIVDGEMQFIDITEDEEGYNKVIEYWSDVFRKCRNAPEVMWHIRKPYRLVFLKYIKDYLPLDDFSSLFAEIWITSENPNGDVNVSIDESASYFKMSNKKCLMDEEELEYYNNLPDTMTVYRGVAKGRVRYGLSWTDDKEVALWFAKRFRGSNYVLQGEAKKEDVLAYFNGRNEQELVIHPSNIKNIKLIYKKEVDGDKIIKEDSYDL